jgi:hypothetical protein
MNRPSVKAINWADFNRIMQRAVTAGTRVEPGDRHRWMAFVTRHRVKEAGFSAYARVYSDTLKPVIVDDSEPDGGYYLFSERDEVCLKWIPREL